MAEVLGDFEQGVHTGFLNDGLDTREAQDSCPEGQGGWAGVYTWGADPKTTWFSPGLQGLVERKELRSPFESRWVSLGAH